MTRRVRPLAAAALCCALTAAAADDPKPPPKEEMKKEDMKAKPGMMKGRGGAAKEFPKLELESAGRDVVYLSADGPVRMRFHARIDGKPAEEVWREAVDKLFAHCDRNRDGSLDAKERGVFTGPRTSYSFVDQDGNVYANGTPQVKFEEKAGKVDGAAFRAAFRAAGLAPVQAAVAAPRSQTAAMTDALFKSLDADKDDKLSADELKAGRDKLVKLDVNEDEIVTSQELIDRGYSNPYGQYVISQVFDGNQPGKAAPPSDFVFPAADPAAAAKELIKARDKNKDGTLTREELGCDAKGLTGLDADKDGRVGAAELTAWLRSPPDLEFRLEFGDATGKRTWVGEALGALSETFRGNKPERPPGLTLSAGKSSRFAGMTKPADDGAVALGLTDARLRFSANRDMKQNLTNNWSAQAQQVKAQFDQQAGDKKVLTRQQFQQDGNLAGMIGLFDFGDRNADGKLEKKEVEDALTALAPLVGCRADVSITDQGRGLFELIDRDADGRLSPRELATAHGVIEALDRDGDGRLAKTEVPKVIAAAAVPASAQVVQTNGFFFGDFAFATPLGGAVSARSANAPTWFNKMDRNGDGDVSRREFLGPADVFKKLDADGDGLVSPEEARAKGK